MSHVDPYIYPETNTLKNWFGETDSKKLLDCEILFSGLRVKEIIDAPLKGEIDFNLVKKTHAYVFQDIYPDWAGEARTIAIGKKEKLLDGKSVMYAAPGNTYTSIEPLSKELFGDLKKQNYLKDMSQQEFTENLSGFMSDLWKIHPFREGNTRTVMLVCHRVAEEAGHPLSLPFIDKMAKHMRKALVLSTVGKRDDLNKIISESISYELNYKNQYAHQSEGLRLAISLLGIGVSLVLSLLFDQKGI